MQAALIDPAAAVGQAIELLGAVNPKNKRGRGKGTVVLTDASDATSSGATGACTINRPCAQQYVGKSQSCMLISGRLIVHAPVQATQCG